MISVIFFNGRCSSEYMDAIIYFQCELNRTLLILDTVSVLIFKTEVNNLRQK
jgi:hypothetical protein